MSGIALISSHARTVNEWAEPTTLELMCELSRDGLELITPYDWRDATHVSDTAWGTVLCDAGGAALPSPFADELRQQLVSFYRRRDPLVMAEKLKQRQLEANKVHAEQLAEQAQKIPNARAFISTLNIGHKTGWSKELAEHLGIHHTNVKRWLKQNLPDVFGLLYPGNSLLAKSLS
jgi:hypothetical protein